MDTTQKSDLVASVIKVVWIGSALALGSVLLKSSSRRSESFGASPKRSSKLMTEKAAINALTTAKGKFMTVTFLKKDGSTRRMRCRTGVKRYVKGVGSPLGTPANRLQKYKLITVYDLDKAGYRSIPVDRVVSVKAAGKTYSSKNPKGKQMSAEEYNSYNAEWEAIFDVYGRRGYFADLPDKLTEERTEDEILDMIMDESDHPEWEEVDEMIPQGIEKHDAESFEADSYLGDKARWEEHMKFIEKMEGTTAARKARDTPLGHYYSNTPDSSSTEYSEIVFDEVTSKWKDAETFEADKYCKTCSVKGHDSCSMTPGCPCCDETIDSLEFAAPYAGGGALMDIGKDTALGSFSPSELATSSAIHGDFDQASLNYSGKQNRSQLEVRQESRSNGRRRFGSTVCRWSESDREED